MSACLALFAAVVGETAPPLSSGIGLWPVLAGGGLLVVWYYLHRISRQLDVVAARLATPVPATKPAPTAANVGGSHDSDLPPETVAVIAAAVHAALGQPVRIVAIADAGDSLRSWSMEGRRQIFASHQIR